MVKLFSVFLVALVWIQIAEVPRRHGQLKNGTRKPKRKGTPKVKTLWQAIQVASDASVVGCFSNVSKSKGWKDEMTKVGISFVNSFPMYRPLNDVNNTCIQDCLLKKLGMMNMDGTTAETHFAKQLQNIQNPTLKEAAGKKYDTCNEGMQTRGVDPCQRAGVFLACMGDLTVMLGPAFRVVGEKIREMNIVGRIQNFDIRNVPSMLATLMPTLLERLPGKKTTPKGGGEEGGEGGEGGEDEFTPDPTGDDGGGGGGGDTGGTQAPGGPTSWGNVEGTPTEDPVARFPFFGWF